MQAQPKGEHRQTVVCTECCSTREPRCGRQALRKSESVNRKEEQSLLIEPSEEMYIDTALLLIFATSERLYHDTGTVGLLAYPCVC